jgi:hypothetical protein
VSTPGDDLLVAVEAHLTATYGGDIVRASVSFLGVDRIDVLRSGPDPSGTVRYATVGMAHRPMGAAQGADRPQPDPGPRAELVLTLRAARDSVLRPLAVLAAAPAVDGLVLAPDGTVELGEPLWAGARCSAVLIDPPNGPPVEAGGHTVELLRVVPITPEELAYRRVHGAGALRAAWRGQRTDLADPDRPPVRLAP